MSSLTGLPRAVRLLARSLPLVLAALAPALHGQAHPRLLFSASDIPALRARTTAEPYKTMYELLLADAETGQYRSYSGPTPEEPGLPTDAYGECINAMRLGFLYVLTGDDWYANRARFYVERRINDTVIPNWWGYASQKGLNLYFNGKSVALTYDWCHGAPSWEAPYSGGLTFSQYVSEKLLVQGDVIATSGGTEQNTNSASNWQGLRGSSALLCYLAGDLAYDPTRFTNMYTKTRTYLRDNLGTGTLSRGWNIEGIGYLGYPYAAVMPAAIGAMRANPANDMVSDLRAMDYACWTQYAATVRFLRGDEVWLLHPDFGDDNATADDANGAYGFAFAFSRPELIPGLHYWYERLLTPEYNYDYTRGGTIFSILYHPGDITETAPLQIPEWRDGFVDTGGNGFFTYRNQYEDETDMVAQMYLKLRGNRGHSGPDALSFRILGLNTAWAVGGGRYGIKTNGQDVFWRSQNTLYPVDPDATLTTNGNSGQVVGTPEVRALGDGHVVSRISRNNVGTVNHKRWFASDHSRAAGVEAVYLVADRSDDGFWWQYNTLDENTITETADGFMVHGMDGATLKGTIVYPSGPYIATTGTRQRGSFFAYRRYGSHNNFYHLRGSGDYLVVLTVAKAGQAHPAVSLVQGRVDPAVVQVGPSRYAITDNGFTRDPDPLVLPPAPGRVAGLSAAPSPHFPEVVLQWDPIPGASGYIVERSDNGGPFVPVANVKAPRSLSSDNNLPAGVDYRYRVRAWGEGGDGPHSVLAMARVSVNSASPYIAFESFEEYAPGAIGGNNGPGGWRSAWTYADSAVVDVSAQPLAAGGVTGGARALDLGWGDDIGRRLFANGVPSLGYGDGVWFSYLLRWKSGVADANDTAWLFNTVGNRDWAFAGLNANGAFRVSDYYQAGANSVQNAMAPGQTVHVVVRVTNTRTDLWLNPSSSSATPLVGYNNTNSKGWRAGFPGLGISSRTTNDDMLIDRIVVARSFAALLQDPAPRPPYEVWRDSFSWPDPAASEPDADPDGDGVSNRAEHIHGTHPLASGPAPIRIGPAPVAAGAAPASAGTQSLAFRVLLREPAALAELTLQTSTTLTGGWTPVDPATITLEVIDGHTCALIPLDLSPGEPQRFLRAVYP